MEQECVKVVAFDIDGTLFRWSFLIEIVERLVKLGKISGNAYASAHALKREWRARQVPFSLYVGAIVDILESKAMIAVSRRDMTTVAREVIDERGQNIYVFTRELLKVVGDYGYKTVAISGSVKEVVNLFAALWGIHDVLATELEYNERGLYTGTVSSTPVHAKDRALTTYLQNSVVPTELLIAVGDTSSDLPMLRMAKYPIAFNPEEALKAQARREGIVCVTERKDTITALSTFKEDPALPDHRLFFERSLVDVLPPLIGAELRARLFAIGYTHP